ncbi:DUF4347 domain-containing protein, partial [Stieleria sp.]|uniref:DUF4347 domain-containing protein n=1 Tax=Stieleria sp. TaxID=2795976 RepID=UPI00356A3ED2
MADTPSFDPTRRLEVVFVDAGVDDSETLLAGLRDGSADGTQWSIVRLSSDEDGVTQITQTLAELSGVDAIHIVSHGDGEGIQLGGVRLDVDTAEGYAGDIAAWANSLDSDADLLIYGCDLASTDQGRALIESIAMLSDADVAASDDATGHESLGGDWNLEYATGTIETQIFVNAQAQREWVQILATVTFQQGDVNGYSGTLDTELEEVSPTADHGAATSIAVDLDNGGGEEQGLIRFDGIVGTDVGDIPKGVQITSASLTVEVTGSSAGTVSLYEMLNNWDETSNWNDFAGLTVGGELASTPDASIAGTSGSQTFTGLEATVQRWVDGYANYGWGILINSTDGWDFNSSEGVTAPTLSVTYIDPGSQASAVHTLTVDTANDVSDGDTTSIDALLANKGADGLISLREAIWATNNTTNLDASTPDVINFAIGAVGSQQTIVLAEALPALTDSVVLDAMSQGGVAYSGNPLIEIDASATANFATAAITVWTSDSTVRGFIVNGSTDEGIEIAGSSGHGAADNNIIENNWVGIDSTGAAAANADIGILVVNGASGNIVRNNVVAGNTGVGIEVRGASVDANIIQGNFVGLLDDGSTIVANSGHGIRVAETATNTLIGTDGNGTNDAAEANVVSGNTGSGIYLDVADGTTIKGNLIGTNNLGTLDKGNTGDGITIASAATNTVIGAAGFGNLISGNDGYGINLLNGSNVTIHANTIGANTAKSGGIRNELSGINIASTQVTSNITVGGLAAGQGNFIAYNFENGITTSGAGGGDSIVGNTITQNGYRGIWSLRSGGMDIFANTVYTNGTRGAYDEVTIGVNHTLYHNTIHGSTADGISVEGAGAILQNNIVTGSAGYGIHLNGGSITTESYNLITDAVTGPANLAGQTFGFTADASDVNADPLYVNSAAGDFSLTNPTSPAIDAGVDLGGSQPDMNGSDPGFYYDAAPDLGAFETDVNDAPIDLTTTSTATGGLGLNNDGGNDTYFVADDGGGLLGGLTTLTIESSFAIDTPGADLSPLLSYADGANDEELALLLKSDGRIWFAANSNGSPLQSTTGTYTQLFDGNKHHVAVSWDATNGAVDFYVDGALVESFTGYQTGQTITGTGELVFGQDQDSVLGGFNTIDVFSGTLYDVRIFNDVRTVGEISTNYDQTLPNTESGMIANWTFNDLSTGGIVTDSVSGNNLTEQHISGGGFTASTPALSMSVSEDATNTTVVGSVSAVDPDAGDTFTYALTDSAGGRFAISAAGEISVANAALIDFESATSHNITVEVTDSASNTYSEVFTINVNDVNESPTVATNTGTTVLEGSTGTAITTAMLNEGDVDDSGAGLTYTITDVTDNGTLYLAGFGALGLNDTFTQADIDAGDVTYDHDGSETTSDA